MRTIPLELIPEGDDTMSTVRLLRNLKFVELVRNTPYVVDKDVTRIYNQMTNEYGIGGVEQCMNENLVQIKTFYRESLRQQFLTIRNIQWVSDRSIAVPPRIYELLMELTSKTFSVSECATQLTRLRIAIQQEQIELFKTDNNCHRNPRQQAYDVPFMRYRFGHLSGYMMEDTLKFGIHNAMEHAVFDRTMEDMIKRNILCDVLYFILMLGAGPVLKNTLARVEYLTSEMNGNYQREWIRRAYEKIDNHKYVSAAGALCLDTTKNVYIQPPEDEHRAYLRDDVVQYLLLNAAYGESFKQKPCHCSNDEACVGGY